MSTQNSKRARTEAVARRVMAELEAAGLGRVDLAEILDMPMSTAHRRAAGVTPFRVDELMTLAKALNLPASAFIDGPPALVTRGGARR